MAPAAIDLPTRSALRPALASRTPSVLRCQPTPYTPMGPEHTLPENIPESAETRANKPTPSLFSLEPWTTLVTGGGRGLGLELANAVLEAGGSVACIDILTEPSPADWVQLQARARKSGLSATYSQCDITKEAELQQTFAEVVFRANEQGKPLNGVIACAGIQQALDAVDYPAEDINRIMNVNVTGAFLTAKYAAQEFLRQSCKGSIVLVASMSGVIANRGLHCSAYNSSKGAVLQLGRSLAQEWGPHGIRVNTLSPGYIRTAMTDKLLADEPELEDAWMRGAMLGRLGAPEDFKAPAIFLLAPGSSWMTGADLRVDGGHTASA